MRFLLTVTMDLEVEGEDAESAYEQFSDGIDDIFGLRDVVVRKVDQREKPYDLPAGAERWAEGAKGARFDDDHEYRGDGRRLWGQHDGSWWWTNGHVMLRCDGPAPTDDTVWRRAPDADLAGAFGFEYARAEATWEGDGAEDGNLRRAGSDSVGMMGAYFDLVDSYDVRWLAGDTPDVPIHALDREGRLVAVVMPMRLPGVAESTRSSKEKP